MYGLQQREVFSFMHSKANPKDQICAQITACECDEDSEQSQYSAQASSTRAGKKQMSTLNFSPDFTHRGGDIQNQPSGDVARELLTLFLLIQTTNAAELITSLLKSRRGFVCTNVLLDVIGRADLLFC